LHGFRLVPTSVTFVRRSSLCFALFCRIR